MVPGKGWLEWLWPQERRGSTRKTSLPLAAYYWNGDAPAPHSVRDISSEGMYLVTEQRWYPNTLVTIMLTRKDKPEDDPARSIRVTAKVIRSGTDGVGFAFMFAPEKRPGNRSRVSDAGERKAFMQFVHGMRKAAKDSVSAVVDPFHMT